jgi:hypothetical protein
MESPPIYISRHKTSDYLREDEALQCFKKAVELLLGFRGFVVPCLHVPGEELEARLCSHETDHPTVGENYGTFHHEKIGSLDGGERGVVLIEIPCGRDRRNGWPPIAKDFSNPLFQSRIADRSKNRIHLQSCLEGVSARWRVRFFSHFLTVYLNSPLEICSSLNTSQKNEYIRRRIENFLEYAFGVVIRK